MCNDRSRIGFPSGIHSLLIFFSCIGLLDRFLQQCINSTAAGTAFVTQKNLQLIAVASFLIAAKVEVRILLTSNYFILLILGNSSSTC
jgi:hypothetical protein